jgi:hypothetical protein
MVDQDTVDEALQRVALAAFIYYPEVHRDEPGYRIGQDVDWCMQPLANLAVDAHERLRHLIGRAIADPTAHRQETFAALTALTATGAHR